MAEVSGVFALNTDDREDFPGHDVSALPDVVNI